MRRFLRQAGYLLVILMLLPYVVTVFVNGRNMSASVSGSSPSVTVRQEKGTKEIPLREYGIGVLAREIDADAEAEALKAQAVLIRTGIYKRIQEGGSSVALTQEYWTRSQMQANWGRAEYGEKYGRLEAAWEDTDGQILLYNGSPALTPYHRLSSGKTRSAAEALGEEGYPYLRVKDCAQDVEAEEAMTTSMIQGKDMEVTKKDSAGYVTEVRCGKETVTGEEFRKLHRLASACFTLQEFEGQTRVTAKGIGHGLGMSQYTAGKMAEDGKTYEEILTYFFEGTTLEEVAEVVVGEN